MKLVQVTRDLPQDGNRFKIGVKGYGAINGDLTAWIDWLSRNGNGRWVFVRYRLKGERLSVAALFRKATPEDEERHRVMVPVVCKVPVNLGDMKRVGCVHLARLLRQHGEVWQRADAYEWPLGAG